jgi:DNA-binding PadR family transcriptional regulator/tetratricopeptide (TPR) repeat protein
MARSTTQRVAPVDPTLGHFSDPQLLVLACLESGPQHGHSMRRMIESMYGTRLGPGALYGAIARLEAKQLIAALPLDERRRPYEITGEGLRLLEAQLATMRRLTGGGIEPPPAEQSKVVPSFYEVESDDDIIDEIDQFAAPKPTPYNQERLPFVQLGPRRFEILTYLLKQNEEPQGAVITLVKASRDGGRDVLVHIGGILSTVVQCKNLSHNFSQPALLEELVKFVLHSYRESYVPETGISYELWIPGGLTQPADTWLASWPQSLVREEVQTAFENVLRTNKTLRSLEWAELGEYVLETLAERIRLSRHEVFSLTQKVRSAPDLYAQFFEIHNVMKEAHVQGALAEQFEVQNERLVNLLTDTVQGNAIDEEINEARDLINQRKVRDASLVLGRLERKQLKLNPRQRYRVASNYGAIAFAENRPEDAARHFLEAVKFAPDEELARINEVFAHYLLQDSARAFQLASERRPQYPHSSRLAMLWISNAPATATIDALESEIDSALLNDAEVCIALARRCMMADQLDRGEEYCSRAIAVMPKWSQPWMARAQMSRRGPMGQPSDGKHRTNAGCTLTAGA